MVKIEITNDYINIFGHALYDDYGKDIVCASLSSIVITSINAILEFNDKAIEVEETKDNLKISIKSQDETTKKLIKNMLNLITELSETYKANIKVLNRGG